MKTSLHYEIVLYYELINNLIFISENYWHERKCDLEKFNESLIALLFVIVL